MKKRRGASGPRRNAIRKPSLVEWRSDTTQKNNARAIAATVSIGSITSHLNSDGVGRTDVSCKIAGYASQISNGQSKKPLNSAPAFECRQPEAAVPMRVPIGSLNLANGRDSREYRREIEMCEICRECAPRQRDTQSGTGPQPGRADPTPVAIITCELLTDRHYWGSNSKRNRLSRAEFVRRSLIFETTAHPGDL